MPRSRMHRQTVLLPIINNLPSRILGGTLIGDVEGLREAIMGWLLVEWPDNGLIAIKTFGRDSFCLFTKSSVAGVFEQVHWALSRCFLFHTFVRAKREADGYSRFIRSEIRRCVHQGAEAQHPISRLRYSVSGLCTKILWLDVYFLLGIFLSCLAQLVAGLPENSNTGTLHFNVQQSRHTC